MCLHNKLIYCRISLVLTYDLLDDRCLEDVNTISIFPLFLKWKKNFRIKKIFHLTGRKIRYKKDSWMLWTGMMSGRKKEKPVFLKGDSEKVLEQYRGSRERARPAKHKGTIALSRFCMCYKIKNGLKHQVFKM